MSRKLLFIVLGLVVLLAGGGAAAWYFHKAPDAAAPAEASAGDPGYTISAHDMTMGNPKAPIVLIEYAAPRCPHCAVFNATVMPLLKSQYIDTGKVFYVFRVFPLGPGDGVAEKIARCMPREKYFPFMDSLFAGQAKWDDEYGITDVRGGLLEMAKGAGMSEDAFNKCVADSSQDDVINKVANDGVTRYAINSTPSIVINGVLQEGMNDWTRLQPALDLMLAGR